MTTEWIAMTEQISLAVAQRSLGDSTYDYPLFPPIVTGCPRTSTEQIQYPLEIAFDYDRVTPDLFDQSSLSNLERWGPLLPPLAPGLSMMEGGTPLIADGALAQWAGITEQVYIKDETRNPTWSHKDRLNLCTTSAALRAGAPGIVVSSSGNHGAAAAAYAARAGLPCIVITTDDAPAAIQSFLLAYGAAVIAVPAAERWPLMRQIVERLGFHPVSNLTPSHTGHPFGPEGYKTIAYEVFLQLGRRQPGAVFIPTGYAELLYGVYKGFLELQKLGLINELPKMIACEPAARAPLARAISNNTPSAEVSPEPTDAYAIGVRVSGYRGVVAIRQSRGRVLAMSDEAASHAQRALAARGLWGELSAAIGLAGIRELAQAGEHVDGPLVAIVTSSGFKDVSVGSQRVPAIDPDWAVVAETLRNRYSMQID